MWKQIPVVRIWTANSKLNQFPFEGNWHMTLKWNYFVYWVLQTSMTSLEKKCATKNTDVSKTSKRHTLILFITCCFWNIPPFSFGEKSVFSCLQTSCGEERHKLLLMTSKDMLRNNKSVEMLQKDSATHNKVPWPLLSYVEEEKKAILCMWQTVSVRAHSCVSLLPR